ncbi:MAG: LAGLIDADG family homing endonuclease [Candidatus Nezhaarchaeales archaeon]
MRGEVGSAPPKSVISIWLNGWSASIGRLRVFDIYITDVSFILEMVLSDGYERFKRRQLGYEVSFYNTNIDYVKMVKEVFKGLGFQPTLGGGEPPSVKGDGASRWTRPYCICCLNKRYIAGAPHEAVKALLRGLWLGDGCVGRSVLFGNTDLKLIKAVVELLRRSE